MDSKYKMIKPLLGTLIDTNVCLPQGPLVNPVNTLRALWNYYGNCHQKIQNSFCLISND